MSEWFGHLLKVSLLLALALGACALLRSHSAALRHWILTIAVACALAMPLLSLALSSWPGVSIWRAWSLPGTESRAAGTDASSTRTVPEQARLFETQAAMAAPSRPRAAFDIAGVAVRAWIAGTLASLLFLVVGLTRLSSFASRARGIDAGPWLTHGEHLRRLYGLPTPVELLQSDHASLLVTWGWRRPRVLLPAAARDWSNDRIRIVLAHELAHLARGDWFAQLAAEALRALYWFNPLVWYVCRRLRVESERACDDAVLACGIEGSDYAAELLALARSLHSSREPMLPAPAMARPSSLEGRIHAMLNRTLDRQPVSWAARLSSVAVLVALTAPLAALQTQTIFYPVSGVVRDSSDRVLPNTRVILTDTQSGAKYEVKTDDSGHFAFVGVPSAEYTIEALLAGFAVAKENLQISSDTERDLRLHLGSLEETISISAQYTPPPTPDAATLQRREESRRRFAERQELERQRCAEGGAATPIGGRILQPAKLRDVRPIYPESMMAAKTGGVVVMNAVIGADGTVREVRNVEGPHPDLEAAAAAAVRQWQFSTTLLNCEPSDVEMRVTVNFTP